MTPIREQVRAAMTKAGVSISELARTAPVDRAGLTDWLNGKTDITVGTLDRIAQALRLALKKST